jgi:hypothetical protein
VPLYTRPVTHDGQRLAKKYGFVSVRSAVPGEETLKTVHKLARPAIVALLTPKIERRHARTVARGVTPEAVRRKAS